MWEKTLFVYNSLQQLSNGTAISLEKQNKQNQNKTIPKQNYLYFNSWLCK